MSDGKLIKMEKDYTKEVDQAIAVSNDLLKKGKFVEALEGLYTLEKLTRTGADMASTSRILVHVVDLCVGRKDWKSLNEQLVVMSKKRGQLKQSITKMVQRAIEMLDKTPDMATKLELIDTLRSVTEGKVRKEFIKIYVEVERARLTRVLSNIKEKEGKIVEATDILQELQVETFGSMEKREKTDFILEQMRLGLAKKDYVKTQIISKKISVKLFQNNEFEDLKIRYYQLMIQLALHSQNFLDISKYYQQIYNSSSVSSDPSQSGEALKHMVIFVCLAPFNNEQSDFIHRVASDKKISNFPLYRDLLKCFINQELVRWPKVEEIFKAELAKTFVFDPKTEEGLKRWMNLRSRIIEHNIRIISKYYTKITMKKMTELLDLSYAETEEFLTDLVVKKTIYAKIDRPASIVSFVPKRLPAEVLNEWTNDISSLLKLIQKTNHLIAKEEMVNRIAANS